MKESPIIMSGDHPLKCLDGTKTMTRRVIVPQPNPCRHRDIFSEREYGYNAPPDWQGQIIDWIDYKYEGRESWFCYVCGNGLRHIDEYSAHGIICPYGQVGDRLWVRETWHVGLSSHGVCPGYKADMKYRCGESMPQLFPLKWKPSIHMPRWASRILLEITEVRVERLQEITGEDAKAEGAEPYGYYFIGGFKELWDSLNAKRGYGWETNPWVWVITFLSCYRC